MKNLESQRLVRAKLTQNLNQLNVLGETQKKHQHDQHNAANLVRCAETCIDLSCCKDDCNKGLVLMSCACA